MGSRRRTRPIAPDEAMFADVRRRAVPFDFVLDEIAELGPYTKPMFGCTAVYVEDKIVFILRDRPTRPADNGVWIATVREHHASLRAELPSMRSIGVLGDGETGWQILPAGVLEFEEHVLRACELVKKRDPRIGKVPKPRRPRVARAKTPRKRARPR